MTWEKARQKITEGTEYTDTVPVPFGNETIELTHRLLNESELLEIEASIDRSELTDHAESDLSDAQQRIQTLQQKDELSDEEERELQELAQQVQAEQAGLMDSMGYDTFQAFMEAGKKALTPSSEDIDNAFDLNSDEQERRFNFRPSTRDEMREALELEMREMVEDQPYPIKLIVGQKAYSESLSLLGDVEGNEAELLT
jgi:hypothetical protein